MPAIPPHAPRAPPSSQPVLPTRQRSAFPSLQRPRPSQPPTFGRPAPSSQTQLPRPTASFRESQVPSQSQRPLSNRLDNRYSPPSSQPSQLFASQRPREVSRPPSSQSQSQHGLLAVDQYRPESTQRRTAAEVYQNDRPSSSAPKAQKGLEILEKIAGLQSWLEEKWSKKEEEDTEFQDSLEDRIKGLEDENKDLKERLHELSMGQKVLPTKEELNEEISSQLTPALNDFLETITETVKKTITPLPESTAELAAGKVKVYMLEMQDLARKEAVKEGAVENPLMTLLNHLITKLNPLDEITTSLAGLSGLPEALEQVAVFQETMKNLQDRLSNRPQQSPAQIQQPSNIDLATQITKMQETIEDIRRKIDDHTTPTVGLDSSKVFGAITGLKRGLEEVKGSIAAGSGGSSGQVGEEVKGMKDLIMEMKAELANMKDTLATLNHTPSSAVVDMETATTLRAILQQLKDQRNPQENNETPAPITQQAHTPTTGTRPSSDDPAPQLESRDLGASPPRIFGRPIRPTTWARQDAGAMRTIGERAVQSDFSVAQVQTDIFGTIQPIFPNPTINGNKKRKSPPQTTLGSGLPIAKSKSIPSQSASQTSSRNTSMGSVANKAKKQKTPTGSLENKQEGLKLGLGLKPTTRSEAGRAKEMGIDILSLESSGSSGRKAKKAGSGSSGERNRIAPNTSDSGDTTWPLGLNIDAESRPRLGMQSRPIEIETPPLPDTQDLGQGESQTQIQSQIQSQEASQTQTQTQSQTQLNNSQTDTLDFGHGQLPSVPSLPAYESTEAETQVDTYIPPRSNATKDNADEMTSTELVKESLALPKRAEPSYRKYQTTRTYGGNSKMHGFLKGNFGLLEDSDDDVE